MKKLSVLFIIAGAMALLFVVGYFIGCPFRLITGIPCPGCGMTRAFASLFHFDFSSAFYYHPLFPLIIISAIAFIACVMCFAKTQGKNILDLNGRDMGTMMNSLFSHKLTIIFVGFYVAAFVVVYILRFPNIP